MKNQLAFKLQSFVIVIITGVTVPLFGQGNLIDTSYTRPALYARAMTGYACPYQQRLSDPQYPAYFGALEFNLRPMIDYNLCIGQSNSIQNRNLFGYEYSWKIKYTFIGAGADLQVRMIGHISIRASAALYRKFVHISLSSENEDIVPYLKEPFQRKYSVAASLALLYDISPATQVFLEGGYQITALSIGFRSRLFYLNKKKE
jgi:hypothetical protein